jgi:uncharacterized membrane protein YbhN (UPF0104 family)
VIDLVTLLFIGAGGLLYLPEMISIVPDYYLILLALFPLLFFAVILIFIAKADAINNFFKGKSVKSKLSGSISRQITKVQYGFSCISTKTQLARIIFISLAIWVAMSAGFSFLARDFFPQVNIIICGSLVAAVNITAIVSIMPGNVGTFQLSAGAILFLAGIDFKDSLTFTVILHVVSLLTVILWGCVSRATLAVLDLKGRYQV